MQEFRGRTALVTGGSGGIGEGLVRAFAAEGASVVIADIQEEQGEKIADDLRRGGMDVSFLLLDVCSEGDWRNAQAVLASGQRPLDILVNAAGILRVGGIEDISFEQHRKVMAVSVDGMFLALKCCLPLLKTRRPGVEYAAVVNVSSIAAFRGQGIALSYAASRAAMLSMTKSAALDWAARSYKVRVNSVHPGSVQTSMSNIMYDNLVEQGQTLEQAKRTMTSLHPIGRLGTVDDIAQAVMFLASDRASWITGTSLIVDGGRLA